MRKCSPSPFHPRSGTMCDLGTAGRQEIKLARRDPVHMNEQPPIIQDSQMLEAFYVPAAVAGETRYLAAVVARSVGLNKNLMVVRQRFNFANQPDRGGVEIAQAGRSANAAFGTSLQTRNHLTESIHRLFGALTKTRGKISPGVAVYVHCRAGDNAAHAALSDCAGNFIWKMIAWI